MARGHKFGAFGGVFTPSVLTILGVIMYMRLPRIIGEGGLWLTLGIILAAHVISVTTGLSVASIATDKKVKAGGPYYIVSRSLGLPIGGTLGLALYVGLSFSVSLYVIGFSESILPLLGYAPNDMDAIRVAGSLTLLAVTVLTLVSTSLAMRIQYVIMVAIALSLIAILFGSTADVAPVAGPALEPAEDGRSVAILFGIFFPAVTGFTAGVNMSGDLKDPRRALPFGTIGAIAVGLVTYVGLAIFLALTIDRAELTGNPNVLLEISVAEWMVFAGVWGATLSSAIGSILGAPRILQAKSLDRLTPQIFAKGSGSANEPRNALLLTFGIAEFGILIGELDVIASVISMFFIMTYGFLNLSCAFESWVSPDFRPDFRIPIWVSVVGALACVVVMIQLNFLAMIAASALMLGTFAIFKRRELRLEGGDTWSGVWSTVVRSGLKRLAKDESHHRNWHPNVMLFSKRGAPSRDPLLAFTKDLMSGRGMITDFELTVDATSRPELGASLNLGERPSEDSALTGFFHRPTPAGDVYDTIDNVCRYYGFSGVEPNTVMLDWREHEGSPERFVGLMDAVRARDLNLIILGHDPRHDFGERRRVDVWPGHDGADLSLALALVRFISASTIWRQCEIRFVLADHDAPRADALKRATMRVLEDARIQARVSATLIAAGDASLEDRMHQESGQADLLIASVPDDRGQADAATWIARNEALLHATSGSLMLIRASARFEDAFRKFASYGQPARAGRPAPATTSVAAPESALALPEVSALRVEAQRFTDGVTAIAEGLEERFIAPLEARHGELAEEVLTLVKRQLSQLVRALEGAPGPRQKKAIARAQTAILFQTRTRLDRFESETRSDQRDLLTRAVAHVLDGISDLTAEAPSFITVERPSVDFEALDDDVPSLRRFKRRRRIGAWLRRRAPRYRIEPTRAYAHALEDRLTTLAWDRAVAFGAASHHVLLELSALVPALAMEVEKLALLAGQEDIAARAEAQADRSDARLAQILAELQSRAAEASGALATGVREIVQMHALDLERIDFTRHVRLNRRRGAAARATRRELTEAPEHWDSNQGLVLARVGLALTAAGVFRRVHAIVDKRQSETQDRLDRAVCQPIADVHSALRDFRAAVDEGRPAALTVRHDFKVHYDPSPTAQGLSRDAQAATEVLPDALEVASNDALGELIAHPFGDAERTVVKARRSVGYLVEAELAGGLQELIMAIPDAEREANVVAQDVVRLVTYSASDVLGEDGADADVAALGDVARGQLLSVLDSGMARVAEALSALRALGPALEQRLNQRLEVVREGLDPYALAGTGDTARPPTTSKGGRAWRAVRGGLARVGGAVKAGVVALVYRRSLRLLLARRIAPGVRQEDALVARSLDMVSASSPRPAVAEALPFYYRQLFLGRSTHDSAFWVGRADLRAQAAQAIRHHAHGYVGALMIVGEAGSGKSALAQVTARTHLDQGRVVRVHAPAGGSANPADFSAAVQDALRLRGSWDELFRTLPDGSGLIIEDLELWWERSAEGLAVVDLLLELIERHGDRCLFIVEISTWAFRAINRFRDLSGRALAVVECEPVDTLTLEEIILTRHRAGGLSYRLDDRDEDSVGDLRRARLFARLFDDSRGLIGPALSAWLVAAERVRNDVLTLAAPLRPDESVLDDLPLDYDALLVQLVLHGALTWSRLAHIAGTDATSLSGTLQTLERMGLVERDGDGVITLNRQVRHRIAHRLEARGLLP